MILQIRGPNGSGKSTIVQEIIKRATVVLPRFTIGRKKPIGYHLNFSPMPVIVMGHYEIQTGGCDTIQKMDDVYEFARNWNTEGHVLMEGIMLSGERLRAIQLHKDGFELKVVALNTPLDECLENVKKRRESKGNDKPFDPDRTIYRATEVRRMMEHLKVAGIPTYWLTREEALEFCLKEFGIS
jgi:hypothetical protein